MQLKSIISGGQTGVDRAALDIARQLGIPHGGWCPAGRRAEDGRIPDRYHLMETPTEDYLQRTEWNVRDSDATLIINSGKLEGGTKATYKYALQHNKPCLIVDPEQPAYVEDFQDWLRLHAVKTLNVAGPRGSKQPWIYCQARNCLIALLGGN